ncbi:tetratricopeptide repeat protein [Vibrio sonorensis]|uniref:tetratricopeptide repeat protein n=1 Tax=Vibrio sonorensis TaxID=1004316 RepID=UPI0008DA9B7D|nr:tetratricopeptide repeat protein [Vibrio sonorensis]
MNLIGIAIGATGLLLLGTFVWMLVLSLRKKRLEQERRERDIAFRKALQKNRKQEREERVFKAENGHIPTILFLAKEAERSNPKEALYWYNKAANLDNITGMYGIVRISNRIREDLILKEQAKFWQISITALEGSLAHQFKRGEAMFHGKGVDRNLVKSIEILEDAAERGNIESMLFLGDWYASPSNAQRMPTRSLDWLRKAASLKSNEGRTKLGLNYIKGIGTPPDHLKGCYWLERAAEKGHTEAMYRAGEAWMDISPNGNAIAYIWLFLGGQLGHEGARVLRDQVALNIGVDTVVGLQAISKPMLKKIKENKVGKHALIKALNKIYKRKVTLIDTVIEPQEELESDTQEPKLDVPMMENLPESTDDGTEDTGEKLDFSQSPIDSNKP